MRMNCPIDPNNSVLHEVGPEPLPGTVKVEHTFPMFRLIKEHRRGYFYYPSINICGKDIEAK